MSGLAILLGLGCAAFSVVALVGVVVLLLRRKPGDPVVIEGKTRIPLTPSEKYNFDIVGEASYLGTLRKIDAGRLALGQSNRS
jgi:hypothetical protein